MSEKCKCNRKDCPSCMFPDTSETCSRSRDAAGYTMELFKNEEIASKSPYLLWLEKHDIKTKYRTDLGPDTEPWEAWIGDYEEKMNNALTSGMCYPDEHPDFVWAESEREAVLELARRNEIPCDYNSYNTE